jgi:hypothetical protein
VNTQFSSTQRHDKKKKGIFFNIISSLSCTKHKWEISSEYLFTGCLLVDLSISYTIKVGFFFATLITINMILAVFWSYLSLDQGLQLLWPVHFLSGFPVLFIYTLCIFRCEAMRILGSDMSNASETVWEMAAYL